MNKVLIIEDDPATVRIYESQLLLADYEVKVARDGQAGLDLLREFRPDAVVLDLMLPKLSGLEFIKTARGDAEFKHVPILVFSNASGTDMVREAMKEGATKFVTKYNCPPKQLVEVLRRILAEAVPSRQVVFPAVIPPSPPPPPAPSVAPARAVSTSSVAEEDLREDYGASVLVLEDNDAFAEVLTLFLESQSFQVTRVTDGVDGLRQIAAQDFDAILCDMVLPKMTGDLFYQTVERAKPHLCRRFVFMTGHKSEPKWERFVRSVEGIMLWKPFPLTELLAALRSIADQDANIPKPVQGDQNPGASAQLAECACLSDPNITLN